MFEILSTCKGGGYRYCRTSPPHPKANANGLYPLHRVLMENKLGRLLRRDEDVHHKDEDKTNDAIENLEVLISADHARRHNPVLEPVTRTCRCGKVFTLAPHLVRLRQRRNKTDDVYCGRSCGARYGGRYKVAA